MAYIRSEPHKCWRIIASESDGTSADEAVVYPKMIIRMTADLGNLTRDEIMSGLNPSSRRYANEPAPSDEIQRNQWRWKLLIIWYSLYCFDLLVEPIASKPETCNSILFDQYISHPNPFEFVSLSEISRNHWD
jgi:hypothetical protein